MQHVTYRTVRVNVGFEKISVVLGTLCGAAIACVLAIILTEATSAVLMVNIGVSFICTEVATILVGYILTGWMFIAVVTKEQKFPVYIEDTLKAKMAFFFVSAVGPFWVFGFLFSPLPENRI